MNSEATLLEKEIKKSVKVRESITKILLDNYPIEKDFAAIIALDTTNAAIGTDRLEKYNAEKALATKQAEDSYKKLRRKEKIKDATIIAISRVIPMGIGICLFLYIVFSIGSCVYGVATAPVYPRTYKPVPETVRFESVRSTTFTDEYKGLNEKMPLVDANELSTLNHLCMHDNIGSYREGAFILDKAPSCINVKKAESLNAALDKAVKEDINGVIWNEPNGNGEVWTVERNNWRFIITATKDENYK